MNTVTAYTNNTGPICDATGRVTDCTCCCLTPADCGNRENMAGICYEYCSEYLVVSVAICIPWVKA